MDRSAEFTSPKRFVGDVLAGTPVEPAPRSGAAADAPAIVFDHVTVTYGRGKKRSEALRNFNLRIALSLIHI